MDSLKLNSYATYLVKVFSQPYKPLQEGGITVNPIVSELASWYEKLRNAIDYRDEEVILRAAIERIIKRRLMLGGAGNTVASPLVRELIWARYFPDGAVPETIIKDVEEVIDNYLELKRLLLEKKILKEKDIHEWIYHLTSAEIEHILNPNREKETMANFMFHVLSQNITILDDTESTKNIQVFIGIRRAYAKDDLAFLRYYLFTQFFGDLTKDNVHEVADNFKEAHTEIEYHLNYKLTHRIHNYIKKRTPQFLILEDVLNSHKKNIFNFLEDREELKKSIEETCQKKYATISSKVRRAIIRSVIFLLISKAIFALVVEGTYENLLYGQIQWATMAANVFVPPFLMVIASLFIRTPGKSNTEKIYNSIQVLLFDEKPRLDYPIQVRLKPTKAKPYLTLIFTFLWLGSFLLSFGGIVYILSRFGFNIISQGVFIFFLAIVSFLIMRINKTAQEYTVEIKPSVLSTIVDFFYLPIAQVGRHLTEGISQINIFLFILDFIIEAPFKGLFMFFEQWFLFMHSKREYLE